LKLQIIKTKKVTKENICLYNNQHLNVGYPRFPDISFVIKTETHLPMGKQQKDGIVDKLARISTHIVRG
jgi:hypothetical protein